MNTRQRTIFNRIKSSTVLYTDHLVVRYGWMWRASPDYVTGFPTHLPDCIVQYHDIKALLPRLKNPRYWIEDNYLVITEGNRTYKFELEEYSDVEDMIPDMSDLSGEDFDASLHKRLRKYTSDDDMRSNLMHVYYGEKGIAATDAWRLYYDFDTKYSKEYLVHRDVANLLIGKDYQITAKKVNQQDKIYIWNEDQVLLQDVNPFPFPNVKAVIPTAGLTYTVDRKELIDMVTEAKIFAPKERAYAIQLNKDGIVAESDGQRFEGKIEIGFEVSINSEFLLEILKESKEDKVVFRLEERKNRPLLVDDNFLIMPILAK